MENNLVFMYEGQLVVSSRKVAEDFNKEHNDVKKKIREVVAMLEDVGENPRIYYVESEYIDSMNRTQTEFLLTKDGFSLLVMGFTGVEALVWKIKYIKEFNRIEEELKTIEQTKSQEYRDFVAQLYGEVYNLEKSLELLKDSYKDFNIETIDELKERLRSERWLTETGISNKGLKELCLVVLDGEICLSKKALDRIRRKIFNDNVKAAYGKYISEDLRDKEIGFKIKK